MRCGQNPADCLACTRAVCVWDETDKLPPVYNWWPRDEYQAIGAALRQAAGAVQLVDSAATRA